MKTTPKKKTLYFLLVMVIATTITYLNHFDNTFHFDDSHAILDNTSIRTIQNIPSFFTDGSTSSSVPQNQTYRPLVTTSISIDYWLGKGYKPFYFHLTNFCFFLLQGLLLYFFFFKILENLNTLKHTFYISALATLFYMLHPVMAETVNYIISRSDIFSTFFVLLAFVIYQYSIIAKKYYLYLIPVFLGMLCKPTAVMFAPLLFCYVYIIDMHKITKKSNNIISKLYLTIKETIIPFLFCFALYLGHRIMLPKSYSTGGGELFYYLITQPSVMAYYFFSAMLPIHLSADTDWVLLDSIWNFQFLIGIFFLISLLTILFISLKNKKYAPISLGICWFLIALAPTSSFIPLAEVMNDHRMFFPYPGLLLSLTYTLYLFYKKIKLDYNLNQTHIIIISILFLSIYAFGTFQRNKVWDSDESLWLDVIEKSPKNGRGLMNYGLSQMRVGKYNDAETYFLKALNYTPHYYILHINLGLLYNIKGDKTKAEKYLKKAISYGSNFYQPYFFYGDFLKNNKRFKESINALEQSLTLAPKHLQTHLFLMDNYLELEQWKKLEQTALKTLAIAPNNIDARKSLIASKNKTSKLDIQEQLIDKSPSENSYLALSNAFFNKKKYLKCIDVAYKVLELNPQNEIAYNNICCSYNELKNFDKAIEFCTKALELNPNYLLAKNNLANALNKKNITTNKINTIKSETEYINESLALFTKQDFIKAIDFCKEGLQHYPKSVILYNNLCATYNQLKQWKLGNEACKKGLMIDSKNQLLKNNFDWSLKHIN